VELYWGIPLREWVPFFTATNVDGATAIPLEDLSVPVRLRRDNAGAVKVNAKGLPVYETVMTIKRQVLLAKARVLFNMQSSVAQIRSEREEAYADTVSLMQTKGDVIRAGEERILADHQREVARQRKAAEAQVRADARAVKAAESNGQTAEPELAGAPA